jgi:hypothetical protein
LNHLIDFKSPFSCGGREIAASRFKSLRVFFHYAPIWTFSRKSFARNTRPLKRQNLQHNEGKKVREVVGDEILFIDK